MPAAPISGPDVPPADELAGAELALGVLEKVVGGIAAGELTRQTPCREFDVAGLTDHLLNSITLLGRAAGAEIPERDIGDSVERQIAAAARPALDAWHRRGLEGTVPFGPGEAPATMMAGIFSLEFLVHAWDYAAATGRPFAPPDTLADYVLGLAQQIITPAARGGAGFDEPRDAGGDASALDRLIAFTGRVPVATD